MGKVADAVTSATICSELVSVVIVQPAATACTSPPRLDIRVANQSERKTGFENGASAVEVVFSLVFLGTSVFTGVWKVGFKIVGREELSVRTVRSKWSQ